MQNYALIKMLWFYVDELIALGYQELRERVGKNQLIELKGPANQPYQIQVQIEKDKILTDSVWVNLKAHAMLNTQLPEQKLKNNPPNGNLEDSAEPIVTTFSMLPSGKTINH